jgi:hypothetical protein
MKVNESNALILSVPDALALHALRKISIAATSLEKTL